MLKNIRDNLSKWVTGVLLFLVAIPLVFMGLGDYRTSSESYAFKIDDKTAFKILKGSTQNVLGMSSLTFFIDILTSTD